MQQPPTPGGEARLAEDPWASLHREALRTLQAEPLLDRHLYATILRWPGLPDSFAAVLGDRLGTPELGAERLAGLVLEAWAAEPALEAALRADLLAIGARDPAAAAGLLTPFLYYKGFHALQLHRVAHWLWGRERRALAYFLQAQAARGLGIDLHPAARFGIGVFIDHGTGVVVGETAVVGNDVSILQGVTLGGTGKEAGDRHPKVRDGVLLGAGAKVLGNVVIGRGAKVGAGSVVLRDVPPCATVAGVPARIVGWCPEAIPALVMSHALPEAGTEGC
ncbi:serine O-acetyltransferase [Siccirubricoccus phaeus]|uniref:serine O-acetyltransferase n=1 Tax=Siccirubricoccus phaeus TaxID=2595053 RepID=UPI0011F32EC4|nr:serine O-acetyltransferase [Siccirubricoccus phaeus]